MAKVLNRISVGVGALILLLTLTACAEDTGTGPGSKVNMPSPTAVPTSTSPPTPTLSPTLTPYIATPTPQPTQFPSGPIPPDILMTCGPTDSQQGIYHPDALIWTPDSSELVFNHRDTIWRVAADGTYLKEVLRANPYLDFWGHPADLFSFRYGLYADLSRDGSQLVYTSCQFPTEHGFRENIPEDPRIRDRDRYLYEIALSGLDGGGQQRLTHNRWVDHYPTWSPVEDRIAFLSSPTAVLGSFDDVRLHTMLPDGSDVQMLAPELGFLSPVPPAWSPDGRLLAFVVNENEHQGLLGPHSIYTVRSDGSELVKIGEMGLGIPRAAPTWSPDGERVAFVRYDGEEASVYTAKFDGTDLRRVWSAGPDSEIWAVSQVSWSPDGSEILFLVVVNERNRSYSSVNFVGPDGGGLRSLGFRGENLQAAWSPDGSKIAVYISNARPYRYTNALVREDTTYEDVLLATVTRDGSELRVLVDIDQDLSIRLAQRTSLEATTGPATSTPDAEPAEPTATPGEK